MPQPLSLVKRDAYLHFHVGTFTADNAGLFHIALEVIARAAFADQGWANLFIILMRSNPLPSYAMFKRLESASAKMAVLKAAAEAVLSNEDYRLLMAVMNAVKGPFKVRHKFAHHIWGHSPDLANCLLLAEPEIFTLMQLEGVERARKWKEGSLQQELPEIDRSKVFVWTQRDLEDAFNDMTMSVVAIRHITERFMVDAGHPSHNDRLQDLLKWPRFSEVLLNTE